MLNDVTTKKYVNNKYINYADPSTVMHLFFKYYPVSHKDMHGLYIYEFRALVSFLRPVTLLFDIALLTSLSSLIRQFWLASKDQESNCFCLVSTSLQACQHTWLFNLGAEDQALLLTWKAVYH